MELSDLKLIQAELSPGPALNIVALEIRKIESKGSMQENTFKAYCGRYGLKPEQFGKVFSLRGTLFRIKGINPRAARFPIECERVYDGKGFKVTAAMAKDAA